MRVPHCCDIIMIYQLFSLACHWSKRVMWLNIHYNWGLPGVSDIAQFSNLPLLWKILKDNKNDSFHWYEDMLGYYFVLRHYICFSESSPFSFSYDLGKLFVSQNRCCQQTYIWVNVLSYARALDLPLTKQVSIIACSLSAINLSDT